MLLNWLYLKDFRNYHEALVKFSKGVNGIVGDNAQGKPNLLEAIYFMITGRSFRTFQLSDMIRSGASYFYLEAGFTKDGFDQTLRIACDGKQRNIALNKAPLTSTSHLLGLLQGVVLTPEDKDIVKGSPQIRRRFLDIHLAQSDPLYVYKLARYNRAMKQRNRLLKLAMIEGIETWEYEMSVAAAYIISKRRQALNILETICHNTQHAISDAADNLSIAYKTTAPESDNLDIIARHYRHLYHKQRSREIDIRSTINGPHRDDFILSIGDKDTRYFASEGQQRSLVASLRFAEWHCLREESGQQPLMAIDDLGISLDNKRKANLCQQLASLNQVFITATGELKEIFPQEPINIIKVENGCIKDSAICLQK